MKYTKEQYEQMINNAQVFYVDREKDPVLWQTEYLKFSTFICEYYKYYILSEESFKELCFELYESINQCIVSFNPREGIFLRYLNKSFKVRRRQKELQDVLDSRYRGIISNSAAKKIYFVLKYAQSKGYDLNDEAVIEKIEKKLSDKLSIPIKTIRSLINLSRISVINETITNQDGEQISLFDTIAASDTNPEEILERQAQKDDSIVILRKIDQVFQSCQDRQKKLLSRLLTRKIIYKPVNDEKKERAIDSWSDDTLPQLASFSFIDMDMVNEYLSSGIVPTQKQIATEFGTSEQSVSRMIKGFKEKLKGFLK